MRVPVRGVRQLELLPAHRLAVTCEGQNGEVIQPPNGSGGHDHAVLIVNKKCRWVDACPVADDLGRIRIVRYTTTEKQYVACTRTAASHVSVLCVSSQQSELDLFSFDEPRRCRAACGCAHSLYRRCFNNK